MMQHKVLIPVLFVSVVGWTAKALAHGASIQHRQMQAVQIEAAYAGGQPMAEAQVTVYRPDDPTTVWKTGMTDESGQFAFVPDQPGQWEVQVRQAGHGDIATIAVSENAVDAAPSKATSSQLNSMGWFSGSGEYSPLEKALYGAAGAWGFFGTALFFARQRKLS